MSYTLFLARKLSFGSDGRGSSPAVKVSIAAVALSVLVMVISVAIVLGFKREIREKVRGFNSDLTLFSEPAHPDESNLVELTPELAARLRGVPGVRSVALNISSPVIFKTSGDFKGVYLKSASSPQIRRFLADNLVEGSLPDFGGAGDGNGNGYSSGSGVGDSDTSGSVVGDIDTSGSVVGDGDISGSGDSSGGSDEEGSQEKIVISRKIADQLGLKAGSRIDTYFITDDVRVRRLEVSGVYDSHFDAYDDLMVYGSEAFLQRMNNLSPLQGTSILMEVDDFNGLDESAREVSRTLFNAMADGELTTAYRIQTAREAGAGYFSWLNMLDTNVAVILTLMMVVGCVTLVSGMLIIILDKRRFIGTLKALGASTVRLRSVFVYLALRTALIGLVIGDLLALTFIVFQHRFHVIPLDPDSYYMDFVPVSLNYPSIIAINLGVLLISYLVLILPSRFVARISPAETMRDETT